MSEKSMRSVFESLLEENPELLSKILKKQEPFEKLEKPQTVRLTTTLRERIERLCPNKRVELLYHTLM